MRREINEYLEINPYSKWKTTYIQIRDRISLKLLHIKIKKLRLGSPKWHEIQEKLSCKSAVGLDMKKRNFFYKKTLPFCGDKIYVHPGVYLSYPQNIELGYNVFINRYAYITAPALIKIGDNVMIGPFVMINSGNHIYNNKNILIRDQGHIKLPIIIENDVWIGAHASILPGVRIGEGAIIAANAVVNKNVEKYTVVGGVPASVIKIRQ